MMRLAANLISVLYIALLPWWGACIALLIFLLIFDFAELILYGFVLDLLYGVPDGIFRAHGFILASFLIYALFTFIRPNIKAI